MDGALILQLTYAMDFVLWEIFYQVQGSVFAPHKELPLRYQDKTHPDGVRNNV
jgi:hypothetical protein